MTLDPHAFLTGLGPAALLGLAVMTFIESGLLFPAFLGHQPIASTRTVRQVVGTSS